jgi:hypothetical protein
MRHDDGMPYSRRGAQAAGFLKTGRGFSGKAGVTGKGKEKERAAAAAVFDDNGLFRVGGRGGKMYAQAREKLPPESKPYRGIVVSGNDEDLDAGPHSLEFYEERSEQFHSLGGGNGTVVYVARYEEGRIGFIFEDLNESREHVILIFNEGLLVKYLSQVKIRGMKKFNHDGVTGTESRGRSFRRARPG